MRSSTDYIVVHCSAKLPDYDYDADIGAAEIDNFHKSIGWSGIGYHYVIRRDGSLEMGRAEDAKGAHVKGYNDCSIGICLIGGVDANNDPEANFTDEQYDSLFKLLQDLESRYSEAYVLGHRDFPGVQKACPSFDVRGWLGI